MTQDDSRLLRYFNLSDRYERLARFTPALLTILVFAPAAFCLSIPVLGWIASIFNGVGVGAVFAVDLSQLSSAVGNKYQRQLFPNWPHDSPTNLRLSPLNNIFIKWPDVSNEDFKAELAKAKEGKNPNNICPIIVYSPNEGITAMWMGDLETEYMEKIESEVDIEPVDILFAPHHGRDSGKVPKTWLDILAPKIIIIGEAPAKYLNYYAGYNTITQNSAKDITFDCVEGLVHIYVSNENYKVDFLKNYAKPDSLGSYLGTLELGAKSNANVY